MKRPALLLILAALTVAACGDYRPGPRRAGSTVEPRGITGASLWETGDSTVTVHAYAGDSWTVTGQSVSFRVPKAYLMTLGGQLGGPVSELMIGYQHGTGQPFLQSHGTHPRDLVALTLYPTGGWPNLRGRPFTADQVLANNRLNADTAPHSDALVRLPQTYCGFQVFESRDPAGWSDPPGNARRLRVAATPGGWPFTHAVLLAQPLPDGRYDTVVGCSSDLGHEDDYPACYARWDYRGYPMRIQVSGRHVCELDGIIAEAEAFLAAHEVTYPSLDRPPLQSASR